MNQKDWFKNWFNSHHYLLLYQNRNEEEAERFFELIKRNIPMQSDWKVLDFCCGYGRLAKIFAKAGFDVTGVDLSEFFIEKAKKTFESLNLKGNFVLCDARLFNEEAKYDLGLSFFTSFGYFSDEENKIAFKNLCSSVKTGGWVVMDYFNPDYVLNNLVEREQFNFESSLITIERKIENNRVNKFINIETNQNREHYFESVRIYSLNDFTGLFEENKFKIEKVFGDYYGDSFDKNSPRMIMFAQKV
jgi:SAM-dependent methyltransferase